MATNARYEVRNAVAEISLDRAPANALDLETLDQLVDALRRAAVDRDVLSVILLSAIPQRFCAGLDLQTLADISASTLHETLRRLYVDLFDAQYHLGKPSIAAVEGAVRGGGMTVAVSCDMVVTSAASTFGYPEIDSGLLPAIHYVHLPRIVGRQQAFDLLFTGRTFSASEAREMGIVSRVITEGTSVLDAARAVAMELNAKPAETIYRGRMAFMAAIDQNYRRDIAAAVEAFCNTANTDAARERLAAFAQKRRITQANQTRS
jgi:enoyl-CoA hydratase/carnithine racemase